VATRAVRLGEGVFLTKFFSGICGVKPVEKEVGSMGVGSMSTV